MRGYRCYRGGYIHSAVPLRLDNHFIFHSVSATNCLQNYNIFPNPQGNNKKKTLSPPFFAVPSILPLSYHYLVTTIGDPS